MAFGHAGQIIASDTAHCKIPGMWIIASTWQTATSGEAVQSPDVWKVKMTETFIIQRKRT